MKKKLIPEMQIKKVVTAIEVSIVAYRMYLEPLKMMIIRFMVCIGVCVYLHIIEKERGHKIRNI